MSKAAMNNHTFGTHTPFYFIFFSSFAYPMWVAYYVAVGWEKIGNKKMGWLGRGLVGE